MSAGVVFMPSFYEAIKELPPGERLAAYDAIVKYGLFGEVVSDLPPAVKAILVLIIPVIDSSRNRYAAAIRNGGKGGRPRKNQNKNQSENQNQNQDKDMEKDIDIDSDKERKEIPRKAETDAHSFPEVWKPLTEDQEEKRRQAGLDALAHFF